MRFLCYGRRLLKAIVIPLKRLRNIILSKYLSKQVLNLDTVVIITNRSSHGRCYKLAYGLKLCNYKVILLHSDQSFSNFDGEIKVLFDEIQIFNSVEDVLFKAIKYRPIAYHIFCCWDYNLAKYFIKMNPGVVVVDTFDVLGGFVRPDILSNYPSQEKAERFCLEHSDGICCRDLRTQYLKRHLGYRLSTRLLWPEYCWPTGFTARLSNKHPDKHVVYVGGMELNQDSVGAFQYDLALLLSKAGIHFHIYPPLPCILPELKRRMSDVIPLELMKYVHIHDTVSFMDLVKELSTYHVGIIISTKHVGYGDEHNTYFKFTEDYFLAGKIFDYHEAGLLCLTQNMRMLKYVFPKNGFVREVQSLEEIVEIVSNMEIRKINVDPKLRIDFNAYRLSEFYLRLYNRRLKRAGS